MGDKVLRNFPNKLLGNRKLDIPHFSICHKIKNINKDYLKGMLSSK